MIFNIYADMIFGDVIVGDACCSILPSNIIKAKQLKI